MSINWPTSFPHPTLQDYYITPDESIARTNMESGVARQRRRFTSVPYKVRVRWIMLSDIFGLFEAWYRHKAKEGAEWIVIQLNNGLGYTSNEARFLNPYSAKMLSDNIWEVNANLEVRDMTVLTEGALDIILNGDFTVEELESSSDNLHMLVNNTIPIVYDWSGE